MIVAGIMEHIEEAGVHSGDSACAIPPYSLPAPVVDEIREATAALARELQVVGLMNVQFAVKKEDGQPTVYVLEVNPRASRTVPFVSKATGMPVAKIAAKVMAGVIAGRAGHRRATRSRATSRSRRASSRSSSSLGVDIVLGPEMRSTGEVMGISERFSIAFAKSQLAAGAVLPREGDDLHQRRRQRPRSTSSTWPGGSRALGYKLMATDGTAGGWRPRASPVERVNKLQEGHPNLLDYPGRRRRGS